MSDIFTGLKIGTKVALGFGLILTLLIIVSSVGYFGLSGANGNFKQYRGYALQTNQMGRVQANLLSARLAAKDFILNNTDKSAEQVSTRVAATIKLVDEAAEMFDRPEAIKQMKEAHGAMEIYQSSFEKVTEFATQRNELVDQLNALGPIAERALTGIMTSAYDDGDPKASFLAGTALRHLLLARLYANRFLVDNAEASAQRTMSEIDGLNSVSSEMIAELQNPNRLKLANTVNDTARSYTAAFTDVKEVIFARNVVITKTLDVVGPQVADHMESMKLDNKALQDELGPRATEAMETAVSNTLLISVISTLIGVVLTFFIGRAISGPIVGMTGAMGSLAKGDLKAEIPASGRADEIGEMSAAVQVFKDNAIAVQRMQKEQEETVIRTAQEKRKQMGDLADSFEGTAGAIIESVAAAATQLQSTASSMTNTARLTDTQVGNVSDAAEKASQNVQTVAAATEELTSSVQEISRQMTEVTSNVSSAVKEAGTSREHIRSLQETSEKIGSVIDIITDIAEQTNLLALNATIEAARAGEAGKGFAVVASEAKNLAGQTAKATEEVSAHINAIQSATNASASAIEVVGEAISSIEGATNTVTATVEQQASATQQIAENTTQAATGAQDVTRGIQGVAEGASETGQASGDVLNASGELSEQAETLRARVNDFMQEVRTAA